MPNYSKKKRQEMAVVKETTVKADASKSADSALLNAKQLIGHYAMLGVPADKECTWCNTIVKILHADDYGVIVEDLESGQRVVKGASFTKNWLDRNSFYKIQKLIEEGEEVIYSPTKEIMIDELLVYICEKNKSFYKRLLKNQELLQYLTLISQITEDKIKQQKEKENEFNNPEN